MGSIHKQKGRKFWYCSFLGADGKWKFKTTGTEDREQAEDNCQTFEKASRLARFGKLTPERAREVITLAVRDILETTGEKLPQDSIGGWCEKWLKSKAAECEGATHKRYKSIITHFLSGLGEKTAKDLTSLRASDIQAFRDTQATELSPATANLSLKVLRMVLNSAVEAELITSNPAKSVKTIKANRGTKRRHFTVPEIKNILEAAGEGEMRGLVLVGLYTGLRLGDAAKLRWSSVDLSNRELKVFTKKTGQTVEIALHNCLFDYLSNLPSLDDPEAYIFPKLGPAAEKRSGTVSNWFHDVLVTAKLATKRSHQADDKSEGRDAGRETSKVSFHSLRHSFVTMLKATGASNAIAQALAGHESEAISRNYTHLGVEDSRGAIEKLPDVTRKTK